MLRRWANENFLLAIVQLARAAGHYVLFTPPHFSDLQPIEILWVRVKGEIGCMYTRDTTLADVGRRLRRQFELLESYKGQNAI